MKKLAGALAIVVVLGVVAAAWLQSTSSKPPETKFLLLDGTTRTSADLRGKVTVVNFWATSCTTCVAEMPMIVRTHEKYRSLGYETIAVAMSYDPPAYVVNFAQTRKLPFPVAIDNTGAAWRRPGVM